MRKNFLLILLCTLIGAYSYAQRRTATEEYYRLTDYGSLQLSGKMTYGYITNEEGKTFKDGTTTINAKLSPTEVSVWPYTVRITGTYTSTSTSSQGYLNGLASSSYKLTVTKLGANSQTVTDTQTFSGAFKKGVPNGAFKVNCSLDGVWGKLTATYNNGKLVGYFSCDVPDQYGNNKAQGNLTAGGKLTGKWTFGDKFSKTFQNGVLITETEIYRGTATSTPSKLVTLAKQYAAGTITEEKLFEQNIVVLTETITLGDYARTAILSYSGFEFSKIKGYDFSESNNVTYQYLKEGAMLTPEGEQAIIKEYIDYYLQERPQEILYGGLNIFSDNKSAKLMIYDRYPEYYKTNANVVNKYLGCVDVYLSVTQSDRIKKTVLDSLKTKTKSLKEYVVAQGGQDVTDYLRENKMSMRTLMDDQEYDRLKTTLRRGLIDFEEDSKPDPTDENLMRIERLNNAHVYHIYKSSIQEYKDAVNNIDSIRMIQAQDCVKGAITLKEYIIEKKKNDEDAVACLIDGKFSDSYLNVDNRAWDDLISSLEYWHDIFTSGREGKTPSVDDTVVFVSDKFVGDKLIKKDSYKEFEDTINALQEARTKAINEAAAKESKSKKGLFKGLGNLFR